jgi:radical SAM superfamily enzyme YgiQ (UPF0313 family)
MIDLLIISVPGVFRKLPPAAPALLKSSVEAAGFSCRTIDYNVKFNIDLDDIDALQTYFATGLNTEVKPQAEKLIERWTKDLLGINPKFVGISVFTYQNRLATEMFCRALRKHSEVKIILGGQGLTDGGILGDSGFGKSMVDQQLADYWIRSEGEVSLVELLKNNLSYPGINSNSFKQIDDLDTIPYPNYDDYEMHLYESAHLPITGSRGCVRSCSFCDVHDHWKYRYRSGECVANEILYLNKKYNVSRFYFTDSLVNGSIKEFNKFTKILAEYNRTISNKISWRGQFIVRSSTQVSDDYWINIADSGGSSLAMGVETGSDQVRHHMNKKFSNADLDYTMQMLEKYKITCHFLIIIGYPTETKKDFQDTLDMFAKYKHLANNIIVGVTIGNTAGILPGTPLYKQATEMHIELDKYEYNWVALDNLELTLEERLRRHDILKQHLVELDYSVSAEYEPTVKMIEKNKDMLQKRLEIKKKFRLKNVT